MGACSSRDKNEFAEYNFTENEFIHIEEIFAELSNEKMKTWRKGTVHKKVLQIHMPENMEFAVKYTDWLKSISLNNQADFTAYITGLEIFCKDSKTHHIHKYDEYSFEKLELFALISMKIYDEIYDAKISYSDAVILFSEIFNAFRNLTANESIDDLAPKITASSIFLPYEREIDLKQFILRTKIKFPQINDVIKNYFISKFIDRDTPHHAPIINETAHILNEDLLLLLYLRSQHFRSNHNMSLLYSLRRDNAVFSKLTNQINDYHGPTLILIKHVDSILAKESHNSDQNVCIFGAFTQKPWIENDTPLETMDTFIFSLVPNFEVFKVKSGKEDDLRLCYLNSQSSRGRVGLGFGRREMQDFRIWIDENILNNSYCQNEDLLFENGPLIKSYSTRLNIADIEIWGLENQNIEKKIPQEEVYVIKQSMKNETISRENIIITNYDVEQSTSTVTASSRVGVNKNQERVKSSANPASRKILSNQEYSNPYSSKYESATLNSSIPPPTTFRQNFFEYENF